MSIRTAVAALIVLLVTASLALAADPYFKSGAPAPSAKAVPAPAAVTPAPAPTEGAPAKDGKAPPATKTTPPPATTSSSFLGQPGEIGCWDRAGNPITKPAYLTSPDAAKVRAIVKGIGPDWRLDSHDRQLRQIRYLKSLLCEKFKLDSKMTEGELAEFALKQYNEAQQAMDLLFKWVIGLSLAVILLVICVVMLFLNKQNKPIKLGRPTTEDVT